ncbi:MAG: EAL domain-containing protein [Sulfurimonas sp.]|uniref:bifunctional diguanylate cyclase/phosphodiesterase n=1 Tax=Sulfurimonas sp. TaxID=2022749 RepID=UPI00260A7CA0|nr:EAL domain-containing protein [Sulfurimonas sp.]MDD2652542.1 EAL domain-containing protein [Sulfurimonas sp.]MDD3451283.1 EAL domain-containing protein [Sulfurimonas sp.]
MQHGKKIIFTILAVQTFSFLILMYLGHYQYITVLDMTVSKKERDTAQLINSIFENIKDEYGKYAREIVSNPNIAEAFAKKDRKELLRLTMPIYKELKGYNEFLSIMHFHTVDNHSFLRLQKPNSFGDYLGDIRPIIVKTNLSKEASSGLEVGKHGVSYRVVFPVFYDGKYAGAFELGLDIKYLISKLAVSNEYVPLFLIDKKAAEPIFMYSQGVDDYLAKFSDEYLIVKYKSSAKDEENVLDVIDERIVNEDNYFVKQNKKEYLVFKSFVLEDYNEKPVGYFVFKNEMDYYKNTILFIRWFSIITSVLIIIAIALLVNVLIRKYTKKINEQKEILDFQAHHDALTGLPNRILFNDRLGQAIIKAERQKTEFALFFIDLDRFKQINDSLGHIFGDKVLKVIAKRLLGVVRREDSLSRLGGDEFTLLAEDLKQEIDISALAKKIIAVLAEPILIEDNTLYVTTSIGISIFPKDNTNADNLLKYADAAMYRAKEEGRNNFQYYSAEMTELALKRVVMEANLRKALKNEEFFVYYQPQVQSRTGKIVGMEALVRWRHPTEGLIYPNSFIQLAQDTGLIVAIDRFVMKIAMKQVSKWYAQGLNPGVLALNLAMKQLAKEDFIDTLNAMFEECKFQPQWLELEVTEGEIMKNPQNAIEVLRKISDMGIELAVDDFGTGYSSLSYLKRLPIDKLKIDKSFVDGLPDNEEDVSIARAIVALAHSLKLSVIAEGVENAEQKEFLAQNECDFIQGYYYSKPMPSNEMQELLKNGSNCFLNK